MLPDPGGISESSGSNSRILIDQGGGEAAKGKRTWHLLVWVF